MSFSTNSTENQARFTCGKFSYTVTRLSETELAAENNACGCKVGLNEAVDGVVKPWKWSYCRKHPSCGSTSMHAEACAQQFVDNRGVKPTSRACDVSPSAPEIVTAIVKVTEEREL